MFIISILGDKKYVINIAYRCAAHSSICMWITWRSLFKCRFLFNRSKVCSEIFAFLTSSWVMSVLLPLCPHLEYNSHSLVFKIKLLVILFAIGINVIDRTCKLLSYIYSWLLNNTEVGVPTLHSWKSSYNSWFLQNITINNLLLTRSLTDNKNSQFTHIFLCYVYYECILTIK